MFRTFIIFVLLAITDALGKCHRQFNITKGFCEKIPTTPVDIDAFKGVWYQLFLPIDDRFQINSCATAQYTPLGDKILNLECEFASFLPRPRCVRDILVRRPDGGPGSFIVSDRPTLIPFDIVAFLGSKRFGYFAAALFQCSANPMRAGYFILARAPMFPYIVLNRLRRKLKCLGFPAPSTKIKIINRTPHVGCKYFFNMDGFDLVNPEDL